LYERLKRFLEDQFGGSVVDLGPVGQTGRISGVIAWDGFLDLDVAERQGTVWDAIRTKFSFESADVSTLVTLTRAEYDDLVDRSMDDGNF